MNEENDIRAKLAAHGVDESTDLLGDPIKPNPPMTAPIPFRVWYLNEYEYWVARNIEELRAAYIENHGEETWTDHCEDARELTDAELEELRVCVTDENDDATGEKISFAEYLRDLNPDEPEYFCGSEW